MFFNLFSRQNLPVSKRFFTVLMAFILAGVGAWFASPALAQIWNDGFGSYADSNPLVIPGGDAKVEEWSRHE